MRINHRIYTGQFNCFHYILQNPITCIPLSSILFGITHVFQYGANGLCVQASTNHSSMKHIASMVGNMYPFVGRTTRNQQAGKNLGASRVAPLESQTSQHKNAIQPETTDQGGPRE